MKKVFFILSVVSLVAFASSCSKEKTCKCDTTYTGTGSENMQDASVTATIKDGECSDGNLEATTNGITTKTTCVEQ